MVKRMLVDANHPEETRVVVIDGTRLEAFDLETSTKEQNKGNIYLAKVVRVEPSLQAAFVDYGGNRHGFLAFSEIHPDYYQIPVADREALLAEAKAHDEAIADDDDLDQSLSLSTSDDNKTEALKQEPVILKDAVTDQGPLDEDVPQDSETVSATEATANGDLTERDADENVSKKEDVLTNTQDNSSSNEISSSQLSDEVEKISDISNENPADSNDETQTTSDSKKPDQHESHEFENKNVEEVGGEDETEENLDSHRRKFVASRRYKIQEVIKRKQILLIQVVKEERGNKGAALTTYLSLAGRYCVLMPNSARGGGVSRKITNVKDRRRLKSIVSDLKIPEHMAVILRTAGAERSKAEVKRDYDYLQRTWNQIREVTMESRAPALIHEEANLIKRSIRDVYSKDIEEILVEGEEGYKAAKDFMKTLTPSHAKKVQRYKDDTIPLFHRYQVESQLDAMHSPTAQLKSGGSIVFGQTEALVAIDVNSGRSTKERHIEETALKTNLEAADEIARQLRLRDLAGLVVIDFIDMDENKNNHAVERRLKEALKSDRARIQVGRISHFGLLELSRQRLRPSLIEANFEVCKSCAGTGMIRSIESTSIQTLRAIEEEGLRHRTSELTVSVHPNVALYILNYKRLGLEEIQKRYEMNVYILGDDSLIPPDVRMERVKGDTQKQSEPAKQLVTETQTEVLVSNDTKEVDDTSSEGPKKKRRRRRKKRTEEVETVSINQDNTSSESSDNLTSDGKKTSQGDSSISDIKREDDEGQTKSRRRGRRGGRRRRRKTEESVTDSSESSSSQQPQPNEEQNTFSDSSNEVSSADPIPVQPSPAVTPKTSSRFLDVFKKGAEAFRSTVSDSNNNASDSKVKTEVKSTHSAEKKSPSTTNTTPKESITPPSQEKLAPAPLEVPSGPPKKGWWNNGTN